MATARDVIGKAEAWLGANEYDGSHRAIIDLYNRHYPLARGYAVRYTDSWCDTFVSAIFIALGATELIGGTECGVEEHTKLFRAAGIWIEDGTVTPEPGDIIVYNWDQSWQPNDGYADHIGIVTGVTGGIIHTIEGNAGHAVRRRTYAIGDGNIRGFARPRYADERPAIEYLTPEPVVVPVSVRDVAEAVLAGVFGNGEERRQKLADAGYNYDQVQAEVNRLARIVPVAKEVLRGEWGNGDERRRRLEEAGYDYAVVQAEVNALLA